MMRVSRKRTFLVTCSWGAAVYICQLRDCSYPPLHPPPLHLSLVSLVCGHAMRRVALTLLPVASIPSITHYPTRPKPELACTGWHCHFLLQHLHIKAAADVHIAIAIATAAAAATIVVAEAPTTCGYYLSHLHIHTYSYCWPGAPRLTVHALSMPGPHGVCMSRWPPTVFCAAVTRARSARPGCPATLTLT